MLTKEIIAKYIRARKLAPCMDVEDYHACAIMRSTACTLAACCLSVLALDPNYDNMNIAMIAGMGSVVPHSFRHYEIRDDRLAESRWYGPTTIEHDGKVYIVSYKVSAKRTDKIDVEEYYIKE